MTAALAFPFPDVPASETAPQDMTSTQLLAALCQGDNRAWREVERRYVRLLWTVAKGCRLSEHDAQDVIQVTWIKLLENANRIREPENLHQWLAVTARREAWQVSARTRNAPILYGEDTPHGLPADDAPVDAELLRREDSEGLWAAVERLPDVQQRVVRALASTDEPTYDEVAEQLRMPRGSLGPTRNRALRTLRVLLTDSQSSTCVAHRRHRTRSEQRRAAS
jgi:RNA polymerase sigma factor (sigma-70 family)